jgi:hypothetical protein
MALKTTLEKLEEVQAAISAVEVAQEQSEDGGGRILRARYDLLVDREEKLLARYQKEQGIGGPAINHGIPRREY